MGIEAIGAAAQAVTRLADNLGELGQAASGLDQAIQKLTGGASGSEGKSDAFQEIQDQIAALSGGNQGGAPQAGGPGSSNEAAQAGAGGAKGNSLLQQISEILKLIAQKLESNELKPEEAGKLLEQVNQLLQSNGGQGATGGGVPDAREIPA